MNDAEERMVRKRAVVAQRRGHFKPIPAAHAWVEANAALALVFVVHDVDG